MGKYDSVVPGLPKLKEEPAYQERVDEVKSGIAMREPVVLASQYAALRLKKDLLNEELSGVNLEIVAYEQLLVASQENGEAGWGAYGVKPNAIRLPSGYTIRVHHEPYGKVMDKEAFRIWCIQNGYERQLQLWPSRMNSLVKERLIAGENPPEGCEAFGVDKVEFVKAGVSSDE
jgi:hypothetical protein